MPAAFFREGVAQLGQGQGVDHLGRREAALARDVRAGTQPADVVRQI